MEPSAMNCIYCIMNSHGISVLLCVHSMGVAESVRGCVLTSLCFSTNHSTCEDIL